MALQYQQLARSTKAGENAEVVFVAKMSPIQRFCCALVPHSEPVVDSARKRMRVEHQYAMKLESYRR